MKRLTKPSLAIISFIFMSGFFGAAGQTAEEKKASIEKMRAETLAELYASKPRARKEIQKSAGYAVFSNVGVNLIFLSVGHGYGVAHNNKTGKNRYMKMLSGGVGLGLGVKDFRGIFIFATQDKLDDFVNSGWEAGAHADAAAKSSGKGDAAAAAFTVAPGIKLYQLTKNGLALQATVQGTKYWKDDELNKK